MKHFCAFSFIVVFSLAVETVLCFGNQKKPSDVGLRKRDSFFKPRYFFLKGRHESAKYLRSNATERNGTSIEDNNDPPIAKRTTTYFPFDVNKKNHNYSLGYIFRKRRISSAQDKKKKSVTIHEGHGIIRSSTTPIHERAKKSVTDYSLHYGRERGSSPTHDTDERNATIFIKHDRRERGSSPTHSTDERNATTYIKHDRKGRGSSPTHSTDERNATIFIKHDRRERGSSPTHSTDERNATFFTKHDRKGRTSSPTHDTDKERATKHERNNSRKSILFPTHATAKSNSLENRKNIVYEGKTKGYAIRDDNKSRSRENTNSTYQRLDLVLKVLNERKTFKAPIVSRKMTCCVNGANETVPAVNLTLTSGRFPWVTRKAHLEVKIRPPKPLINAERTINQTTGSIHKSIISIAKVLQPWNKVRRLLIKCPESKPFFDVRSKTCKQATVPSSEIRIAMHLTTGKNETMEQPKNVNDTLEVTILKTRNIFKKCTALQKYEKHEYTILYDDDSAVYVRKTGEVLQSKDYFRNLTLANDSQAIFVCRQSQISNCSGVYILINEGDFRVLMNKSIFLNASKQVYDRSEYTWINKSVLVCENFSTTYYKSKVVSNDDPLLTTITLVCMSLSIIGLVFVLVTYSLFSELRTPPGINLMNLSVSILLTQLLWILGSGQTDTPIACTVIAVILHYLFLVSFMWTSIIAFDTWKAFSGKGRRRPLADSKAQIIKQCLRYMAVGWLPVMIYVVICFVFDELNIATIGYGSAYGCWIAHYYAKLYFFGVPVLTFILFNLAFYSMTVKAIRKTRRQTKLIDAEHLEKKKDFWIYVRIAALMGFTWIFGFAAPFGWQFLWYPFVLFNSLQGVYIALAFGVNRRARKLYIGLVRGKKQTKEKCVSNQERSTKQSVVVLEFQGLTATHV